jgi:hypothetical protein
MMRQKDPSPLVKLGVARVNANAIPNPVPPLKDTASRPLAP